MAASMFESDLIATLAQIPVGQFTDRFRKRDFGLMPFFLGDPLSSVSQSRSL